MRDFCVSVSITLSTCVMIYIVCTMLAQCHIHCSTTKTGKSDMDRILDQSIKFLLRFLKAISIISVSRDCYWVTFDLYADAQEQMLFRLSGLTVIYDEML